MIPKTIELVKEVIEKYGPFPRVLEVGSRNTAEDSKTEIGKLFPTSKFVGVDLYNGMNVTIRMNGHSLIHLFPQESFDLVMTFDTLEHDDNFWLTVMQMKMLLKTGGIMAIGVPGIACPLHEENGKYEDYYRFTQKSMNVFFDGFQVLIQRNLENNGEIQGVGRKL